MIVPIGKSAKWFSQKRKLERIMTLALEIDPDILQGLSDALDRENEWSMEQVEILATVKLLHEQMLDHARSNSVKDRSGRSGQLN